MASFPDLRPRACLVSAECRAALCFRRLVGLLTAFAVLRDIAFVAVSELATLRGHKAPTTSTFPTREPKPASLAGNPTVEASEA